MTAALNVGIIGCGKIAQVRHIPEFAANPQAGLAGYYDINRSRTEQLAAQYGGTVFESWQAMLDDSGIEAVCVCTPNDSHAEITIAALRAGKAVLAEKPMGMTLGECELIAEVARRGGAFLMYDHNQRFTTAHQLARQAYLGGAIGELVSFRTTIGHAGPEIWSVDPGPSTWFFDPAKTTMGAIGDLGVHKTDLIQYLSGQRVVEVAARLATLEKVDATGAPIPLDDHAIAVYTLSNGAVGTMTASWCFHGAEDNSTVLYGREGTIATYADPDYQLIITKPGVAPQRQAVEPIQTNDNQTPSGVMDLFTRAVLAGEPSPVSGEEALAAMRAVFAAMESSRTGRVVEIPENRRIAG